MGDFQIGQYVRKTKGSCWHGRIVGRYNTSLTADGYAVESYYEHGSVQIYPASALELWEPPLGQDAEITRLTAEVERLREALSAEREDNLWSAYHSGHVKDGQWTHMLMSDGEWLARECGLDPTQSHYDDRAVRDAIPAAAQRALAAGKVNP